MPFDTSMPLDKLPPHNVAAEESVLGSVLVDSSVLKEFADVLSPADFYTDSARWIYTGMLNMRERGVGINQVTLAQELDRMGKLDMVGGAAYLTHLIITTPTSFDAYHYATIVHNLAINRAIITAGLQIQNIGYTADPDLDTSLSAADALIVSLRRSSGCQEIIGPQERAEQLYDRYEKLARGEVQPSIPTGFYDLDRMLGGGFFGGQLILLGADSGLGKSTIAQTIAVNQSNQGNVLFISGEMPVDTLSDKEVAALTRRDVLDIVSGRYDDDLLTDIQNALGVISTRNVYYSMPRTFNLSTIHQEMESMSARHGLKAVVIDYLQLIESASKSSANRYQELGDITKTLKRYALEYNVPILLLCQLSRDLEKRSDKRPCKSDLYESKRPEQDADVILLLYRVDRYYTPEDWAADYKTYGDEYGWTHVYPDGEFPAGIAEIIIDKQRIGGNGNRRIVKARWDADRQCYQNLEYARAR